MNIQNIQNLNFLNRRYQEPDVLSHICFLLSNCEIKEDCNCRSGPKYCKTQLTGQGNMSLLFFGSHHTVGFIKKYWYMSWKIRVVLKFKMVQSNQI